jgi:hypothetical protein
MRISFIQFNESNHFIGAYIPEICKDNKPDRPVPSTTGIKKNAVKIMTPQSSEDWKKHGLSPFSSAKSAPSGELQSRYIIGSCKIMLNVLGTVKRSP